jgi:predicted RND superfamily exporter protein
MFNNFRKTAAILLSLIVLFFTVISVLAIWDVIDIQHILSKSLGTLLVIFVSSAIILFIFAVIMKEEDK